MHPVRLIIFSLAVAFAAQAHFTFVIPWPGGDVAEMILGETLSSQDTVNPAIAAGARLKIRDSAGTVTDLTMAQDGHRFVMQLPGQGNRLVYGTADLGVSQRGNSPKPHLLLYYPKTILGDPFAAGATAGADQVLELVPQGEPGRVRLQLLARGVPQPETEFTVILPGGTSQKVKTGADGFAGPFSQSGRYGAWARYWEDKAGERAGVKYEQVRHYAMLVFDAYAQPAVGRPLPEKTSSFGAVADAGWLYVYGGHVARTHNYSTESVSGRFSRLRQDTGVWEELPAGTPLQGLNLAAHGGRVCRVGGMTPRNKPGEKTDNHSVAEAACYQPAQRAWQPLPPLPEARSSHDVAVIGDRLIVSGGWMLRGAEPTLWAKTTLILDLKNPAAEWVSVPQPFERRALVTAVHGGRMYVIGGITPSGKVSTDVDIYDPAKSVWTKGPALPGTEMNGFAPAAAVHGGKLFASVADGSLYALDDAHSRWTDAGRSAARLAHRMVSLGDSLVIAGGAVKGGNLDLVERVPVP